MLLRVSNLPTSGPYAASLTDLDVGPTIVIEAVLDGELAVPYTRNPLQRG